MSASADVDALVTSASKEALERIVKAAIASGAVSRDQLARAVSGQFQGKPRVLGVIPARFGSTRFPGKPLAELGGKPMIWVRNLPPQAFLFTPSAEGHRTARTQLNYVLCLRAAHVHQRSQVEEP